MYAVPGTIASVTASLERFSTSAQPRVMIFGAPVAGYSTSRAVRFAFVRSTASFSDTDGVPDRRTGVPRASVR